MDTVLGPIPFTSSLMIFMLDYSCTISNFADDTKLAGVIDAPESHLTIQRDLNRLQKGVGMNFMEFSKEKYEVLHLGRNYPRYQCRLGTDKLVEKYLGSWWTPS